MTLEERIEAAARARYELHRDSSPSIKSTTLPWDETSEAKRRHYRDWMRDLLGAFAPELFTSPPTGWIAPWEATEEMENAISALDDHDDHEAAQWRGARDAYLNREGK